MSDSIKVAIKVRPLIKREKDENLPIQWTTQGNAIVAVDSELKKRGDGGFQFGKLRIQILMLRSANTCDFFRNVFLEHDCGFNSTGFIFLSCTLLSIVFFIYFSLISFNSQVHVIVIQFGNVM